MSQASLTDATDGLRPVASNERIQALDVVRGFALIGIFLMNIEFFNRPIAELGLGLPNPANRADWWAGYLIYILVQGKFWTMFSLLFGMGFAVMLTRAERAGRNFLVPYIRRILALAAFGTLHHIFLWSGDILFSYAVGATCLLLLLWARWLPLVIGIVVVLLAGLSSGTGGFVPVVGGLVAVLLGAVFLRTEARVGADVPGGLPWLSVVFFAVGAIALLAAIAAGLLSFIPADWRWPLVILAIVGTALGALSWRYKDPVEPRTRRLGVGMYLLPWSIMLMFGLLIVFGPTRPTPSEAQVAAATAEIEAQEAEAKGAETSKAAAAMSKAKAEPPEKSPVEKAAMHEAQDRINRAEQAADVANERQLETAGRYIDLVRMRAGEFAEHAPGEFGFAIIIIGMFLLGSWFVRSGVMEDTRAHLSLFRRMALLGIPIGVGLGIAGSLIATNETPGMQHDPYQIAIAMTMIGNLPACLGYVGLIVLMLNSDTVFSRVRVLAPLGRMALTNYLTHSLVSSLVFYHYGLGLFGIPRATQVVFVFTVIALQVVFCHIWLAFFRYGPMEWLWRAITYWQLPQFRRESAAAITTGAAV